MRKITLEIDELQDNREGSRKVGKLRRKANNKTYISPRIVLSSKDNDSIGKSFRTHKGRGKLIIDYDKEDFNKTSQRGKFILLFFPDSWNKDDLSSDS